MCLSLHERNSQHKIISPELLSYFLFNHGSAHRCPTNGPTIIECHQCDRECSIINEENEEIEAWGFIIFSPDEPRLDEIF